MLATFYNTKSDNRCLNKSLIQVDLGTRRARIDSNVLCPIVTGADPAVTASSEVSIYPGWAAFNGVINTHWNSPGDPPTTDTCWTADPSDAAPYIVYHMPHESHINKVTITAGSDYMGDWVGNIYIMGSVDGVTYESICDSTITAPVNTSATVDFTCDDTNSYNYLKIAFDQPICVPYGISMMFTSIQASGYYFGDVPIEHLDVTFKDDESREDPRLILSYNSHIEEANYVEFNNHYYYIMGMTYSQQRIILQLHEDVLMTYRDKILNLGAILDRQENEGNPYLKDSEMPVEAKRSVQCKIFPKGFSGDTYILATTGA